MKMRPVRWCALPCMLMVLSAWSGLLGITQTAHGALDPLAEAKSGGSLLTSASVDVDTGAPLLGLVSLTEDPGVAYSLRLTNEEQPGLAPIVFDLANMNDGTWSVDVLLSPERTASFLVDTSEGDPTIEDVHHAVLEMAIAAHDAIWAEGGSSEADCEEIDRGGGHSGYSCFASPPAEPPPGIFGQTSQRPANLDTLSERCYNRSDGCGSAPSKHVIEIGLCPFCYSYTVADWSCCCKRLNTDLWCGGSGEMLKNALDGFTACVSHKMGLSRFSLPRLLNSISLIDGFMRWMYDSAGITDDDINPYFMYGDSWWTVGERRQAASEACICGGDKPVALCNEHMVKGTDTLNIANFSCKILDCDDHPTTVVYKKWPTGHPEPPEDWGGPFTNSSSGLDLYFATYESDLRCGARKSLFAHDAELCDAISWREKLICIDTQNGLWGYRIDPVSSQPLPGAKRLLCRPPDGPECDHVVTLDCPAYTCYEEGCKYFRDCTYVDDYGQTRTWEHLPTCYDMYGCGGYDHIAWSTPERKHVRVFYSNGEVSYCNADYFQCHLNVRSEGNVTPCPPESIDCDGDNSCEAIMD